MTRILFRAAACAAVTFCLILAGCDTGKSGVTLPKTGGAPPTDKPAGDGTEIKAPPAPPTGVK